MKGYIIEGIFMIIPNLVRDNKINTIPDKILKGMGLAFICGK